jgi:Tol biopolymer transport system component
MPDARNVLERIGDRVAAPEPAFERLLRRRDRKRRNQRIAAAVVAIVVIAAVLAGIAGSYERGPRPADLPTDIFSTMRGRIVYGGDADGVPFMGVATANVQNAVPGGGVWHVWAMDPSRPEDAPIELSAPDGVVLGSPIAWSRNGSRLLMYVLLDEPGSRYGDLYVLNADGTETRVAHGVGIQPGGSFSPDGSEVVYSAPARETPDSLAGDGIYVVSSDGGTPQLVLAPERRTFPDGGTDTTALSSPAFSPDGTQIVFVDGIRDNGNTIRAMNADGSGVRVLVDERSMPAEGCIWLGPVLWSPDGSRLVFGCQEGVWLIDADGSGLRRLTNDASNPQWSPDGTQIAFRRPAFPGSRTQTVEISSTDGTDVRSIGDGATGPWLP